MSRTLRVSGLFALLLCFSSPSWAQLCAMDGNITGEDGSPLKGAVVKMTRTDGDGVYKVKTDKKGHFYHGGLPHGLFKVSVEIEEKEADSVSNIRTEYPPKIVTVDFDLRATAARRAQLQKAAAGKLTAKETRKLSPEERAVIDATSKEKERLASKNKDLNEAYGAGQTAFAAKQYDEAITQFTRASQLDASQMAVWNYLAQSYVGLGDARTGTERQESYEKACDAYQKAIAQKDDAALHGKHALVLFKLNKTEEAEAEFRRAAELDPPNAAKYYFNMGTIFLNAGQNDSAGAAFKKALEADPNFAEAQFQYAVFLSAGMAPPGPDGKVSAPPGMKEALEKYLALAPNGPNVEAARSLLALIGSSISTSFENPKQDKGKKR